MGSILRVVCLSLLFCNGFINCMNKHQVQSGLSKLLAQILRKHPNQQNDILKRFGKLAPKGRCDVTEKGKACVFPFTYLGVTYNECTSVGETWPWCATKVDKNGGWMKGEDDWCHKECDKDCSIGTKHEPCVFPFIYKGKKYTSCTSVEEHNPWCSTKVDRKGGYMKGYSAWCKPGCDGKSNDKKQHGHSLRACVCQNKKMFCLIYKPADVHGYKQGHNHGHHYKEPAITGTNAQLAKELQRYTEEASKLKQWEREHVFQQLNNCHGSFNTMICNEPLTACWRDVCWSIGESGCRNA